MKKTLGLIGTTAVVGLGVLAFTTPAQAEPTGDCRTATVNLTDRPDTGTGGHVWAKDTMARTLKVCAEAVSGDTVKAESTTWKYSATITDSGTFKTNAGKTPRGEDGLPANVTGTVNGHFSAKFTAASNFSDWAPTGPKNDTPTSQWVKAAMPSAEGDFILDYHWTYKSSCETYKDDNDEYTGDITKLCATTDPTPPVVVPPTTTPKECAAYVYTGTNESLCADFPNNTKLNCTQAKYRVTLKDVKNDPWGLDSGTAGVKGVGCESNPLKPKATPSPSHTTPSPSHTTTPPVAGGGNNTGGLPVTGNKIKTIGVIGGVLLVGGVIATVVTRRRNKVEFQA